VYIYIYIYIYICVYMYMMRPNSHFKALYLVKCCHFIMLTWLFVYLIPVSIWLLHDTHMHFLKYLKKRYCLEIISTFDTFIYLHIIIHVVYKLHPDQIVDVRVRLGNLFSLKNFFQVTHLDVCKNMLRVYLSIKTRHSNMKSHNYSERLQPPATDGLSGYRKWMDNYSEDLNEAAR